MITIKGLHKYFNRGRQNEIHVINDIDLELPEKGMVAIFGKSGCGKTTLLNVIGGLDSFAGGSLKVEGKAIEKNTDDIRNRYMGYIFQNYNLSKSESCFENVADALRLCGMEDEDEIERRVMVALSNVGMDKYRNRTPDTLSGGQQQRIAIARAIVKNPRIVLADEPTGNLDEANTVMIMDLLKCIAKDHLVLLVTHEANLVDFYCDTVIELSDGKVVSIKNNIDADGFCARDKNDIYLGELERSELVNEKAEIEYYGEAAETPIKLRIVNNGGKLYVQIDTPKVQMLDDFSEVKLREGIFEEKQKQRAEESAIDMSALPPVEGKRVGRLFSLASSIKSGYVANFKNRKKGKKILRGCMCLFAAVIVFMTAVFGRSFEEIINAKDSYNHNVFYVYSTEDISSKLNGAVGSADSGIDYVSLYYGIPYGDRDVKFMTGFFETFSSSSYDESFRTNAVFLDSSLCKAFPLVVGKKEALEDNELVITTAVADALLELSSVGYIKEYDDLIGLITNSAYIDGNNLRIAGVVESEESSVYLSELTMAKYIMRNSGMRVTVASNYDIEISRGKAVLMLRYAEEGVKYPKVGETIQIHGTSVEVEKIMRHYPDYESWLKANSVTKQDMEEYFRSKVQKEYPNIDKDTEVYYERLNEARNKYYFDYYDYYYSNLNSFLEDYYFFEPGFFDVWLATQSGVKNAELFFTNEEYHRAVLYKQANGSYPSYANIEELPKIDYNAMDKYRVQYENEFWKQQNQYNDISMNHTYLVSDGDYITFSKKLGETHQTARSNLEYSYGYKEDIIVQEVAVDMEYSSNVMVDYAYTSEDVYTVVHSSDPDKTDYWIKHNIGIIDTKSAYMPGLITPDSIFEDIIEANRKDITISLITMGAVFAVMSVCMYFIMRSSLMNRIKEVGIYRAIGVSKKNLVFKFFIEAIVLATLSVFIGYLFTSAFIFVCLGASSLVSIIFFYPVWLAVAVLIVIYALCLFCGTLPILSLLRKTPSAILAKYDI